MSYDRQRNLRDDERMAKAERHATSGGAASVAFQRILRTSARRLEDGKKASSTAEPIAKIDAQPSTRLLIAAVTAAVDHRCQLHAATWCILAGCR